MITDALEVLEMTEWLHDKSVLVVGMARSGIAAAELLAKHGAKAVLSDQKTHIEGIDRLTRLGCESRLGEPPEALIDRCDLVVVSPAIPQDAPVILAAKAMDIPVIAELELAARCLPGITVAITGTNGKTTTSTLLGDIFTKAGKMTKVAGNIGLPLSAVSLIAGPEDYTVIEVSSFQLEHMPSFHPNGAAILNLTPDHLNRHGTMEAYGALKESMLRNQEAGDFFVYNADDPYCVAVAARAKARAIPFSRTKPQRQGAWIEDGQLILEGRALCDASELGSGLPGPHNLENALAAAAMAMALSIPAPVIRHTLRTFPGVEHRMEAVRSFKGVRYINDSKGTNPDSSIQAVKSMSVPTILIAGGQDKQISFHGFAEAIHQNENIRHVVLIGDTANHIAEALSAVGYSAFTIAGYDFEKAVETAQGLAVEGGAVLLSPACASFDMFNDFEERGARFKELVHALR